MKKKPKAIYVAMQPDGAIMYDKNGAPLMDTAKGELIDRTNDMYPDVAFEVWRYAATSCPYHTPKAKALGAPPAIENAVEGDL